MRLITLLLLTSFSFFINEGQAQTADENLAKYWNYRARLVGTDGHGGFLDIGVGPGMSLPASERYPQTNCRKDWFLKHHKCKTHKGSGKIFWGDATCYLGSYIAVLALEYANLERAKQSTTAVAQELWYALETFERLDSMAEVSLGLEGKKDGFFLRDDVPYDFYIQKEAKNERRFAKDSFYFDCISSAYSCGDVSAATGSFISQDQVLALFTGFLTVKQLIPNKKYKEHLPTFGEKVALNTHRILTYMLSNKWKLKDPNGNAIPDEWGGNAIGLSFAVASIANKITDGKYQKTYLRKGAGGSGHFIYDMLHVSLGVQSYFNKVMAVSSMAMLNKAKNKAIARKALKHDMIIYPLLNAVLFDNKLAHKITKKELDVFVNSAPWDGPCFNTPNCNAPDGWKSYDRWFHPTFKNGNPYGVHSETVGLDYMLLYNLYHYYYQKRLPPYQKND